MCGDRLEKVATNSSGLCVVVEEEAGGGAAESVSETYFSGRISAAGEGTAAGEGVPCAGEGGGDSGGVGKLGG